MNAEHLICRNEWKNNENMRSKSTAGQQEQDEMKKKKPKGINIKLMYDCGEKEAYIYLYLLYYIILMWRKVCGRVKIRTDKWSKWMNRNGIFI